MKQRGQFALPIMGWLAVAAGVVFVVMGIVIKAQSARLATCKQEFAAFQAQVKALGDVARAKAKAEAERQAKLLKETEAQSEKAKSDLSAANQRLRDERARSRRVPPAPEGSKRPDLACFDRALLESAIQRLDAGVSGLVDQGDQNTLRLKLSRDWSAEALKQ